VGVLTGFELRIAVVADCKMRAPAIQPRICRWQVVSQISAVRLSKNYRIWLLNVAANDRFDRTRPAAKGRQGE
jgi:hypothetical protein